MKDWTWKHVLGLAAVLFGVWLISYIVEWNIRHGAEKYWGDALFEWWGDMAMLQWVQGYQTLLGGVFALGAGAFVVWSSVYQRSNEIADRSRQAREEFLTTMLIIQLAYQRAAMFAEEKLLNQFDEAIKEIDRLHPKLVRAHPQLVSFFLTTNARIQFARAKAPEDWKQPCGQCLLAYFFIDHPSRMFDTHGRFVGIPRRALTDYERQAFAGAGLDLSEFAYAAKLFDLN